MNVIVRPPKNLASASPISADERARRKAAIDYAYGSVRLEGMEPDDHVKELNRRYIAGELTRQELTAAILAHCKL